MKAPALILDSVHAVETAKLKGSDHVCASPLCAKRFKPGGMAMSPKRFCSTVCRQQASLIRRVSKLVENLSDAEVVQIIRGAP